MSAVDILDTLDRRTLRTLNSLIHERKLAVIAGRCDEPTKTLQAHGYEFDIYAYAVNVYAAGDTPVCVLTASEIQSTLTRKTWDWVRYQEGLENSQSEVR